MKLWPTRFTPVIAITRFIIATVTLQSTTHLNASWEKPGSSSCHAPLSDAFQARGFCLKLVPQPGSRQAWPLKGRKARSRLEDPDAVGRTPCYLVAAQPEKGAVASLARAPALAKPAASPAATPSSSRLRFLPFNAAAPQPTATSTLDPAPASISYYVIIERDGRILWTVGNSVVS